MTILYRHLFYLGLCGVLFAGCADLSTSHHQASKAQPLERVSVPQPAREHDALALELAGEFALNRGELEAAASHFVEAARASDDPDVAAQATRVALAAKQWKQAHEALQRWETLRGEDPGLWQARGMLAVHDGKADAAYADFL